MSEQNSTQEVNKRENQWIVLSQICMAWQGTVILTSVLKEELIHDCIVMGLQNCELSEKLPLHLNLTLTKRDGETRTKYS